MFGDRRAQSLDDALIGLRETRLRRGAPRAQEGSAQALLPYEAFIPKTPVAAEVVAREAGGCDAVVPGIEPTDDDWACEGAEGGMVWG